MIFENKWDLSETRSIKNKNPIYDLLPIKELSEVDKYLNPVYEHLHDPFLFDGMHDAINIILSAKNKEQAVLIYGDYDADGICATAILYEYLKQEGFNVSYFLPDRKNFGYGLTDEGIDAAFEKQPDTKLLITVDCGITAMEQVEYLNRKGIDCIITDHHLPKESLPDANAIICSHLPEQRYPYKHLCGAGIALKVIQALREKLDSEIKINKYLTYAALGTIADSVPLTGENRTIVKLGTKDIENTEIPGLRQLIRRIKPDTSVYMDTSLFIYNLIPRINAPGRMDIPDHAFRLLVEQDMHVITDTLDKIESLNNQRREYQTRIKQSVMEYIESDEKILNSRVIVLSDQNSDIEFDIGIIGIVASQISDQYNRPCILFFVDKDNENTESDCIGNYTLARASARSVEGFDMEDALNDSSDLLIEYGGHKMAAGITVNVENITLFNERINAYAKKIGFQVTSLKTQKPDYQIETIDIFKKYIDDLINIEPYGTDNKKPLFYMSEVKLLNKRFIGSNKYSLSLVMKKNNEIFTAVYFSSSEKAPFLLTTQKTDSNKADAYSYDILFTITPNNYCRTNKDENTVHRIKQLSIEIADIRLSHIQPICRQDVINIFRYIESSGQGSTMDLLSLPEYIDRVHFLVCLEILRELYIIEYNTRDSDTIFITGIYNDNSRGKKNLEESLIYNRINANEQH